MEFERSRQQRVGAKLKVEGGTGGEKRKEEGEVNRKNKTMILLRETKIKV